MADIAAQQADIRRRQRQDELCAAAIRALAGERDLQFRGHRLHRGRQPLPLFAAHLHLPPGQDDFAVLRGTADGLALRLARSDAALHRREAPADPVERAVFDLLEQFRAEAQLGAGHPGVQRNLDAAFTRWTLDYHHARLTETTRGMLLFTIAQVCRAKVCQRPVLEGIEDLLEGSRMAIGPTLGPMLAALVRTRHDQAAYAVPARQVAALAARLLDDAASGQSPVDARSRAQTARSALGLPIEAEPEADDAAVPLAPSGHSRVLAEAEGGYRVFTTAHDQLLRPAERLRPTQLAEYRERLDTRVAPLAPLVPRLARQLEALLATARHDDWLGAQEEGLIDGRRLAQLVSSPQERRLFRQHLHTPAADCALTLLIDCSGSMRAHIEAVAALAETLTRALDSLGVATEVLGFSTATWHGGPALRDWRQAGRPPHPGRLNATAHYILKDADTPWRRARRALAALLEPTLLREGIDGEALAWAAGRLLARPEARRLLVVVSDGCPMDGATQQANDAHYLDHHLQQVAGAIEDAGRIELYALGVGLDLSPYYRHSRPIDLSHGADAHALADVVALLARGQRPGGALAYAADPTLAPLPRSTA